MKNLCVFLSANKTKAIYTEAVKQLARIISQEKITLIYGGAKVGLMGTLADTVLENQGQVVGVIPTSLNPDEIAHPGLTQLYTVETMPERKAMMSYLADSFIIVPGGLGTMEEFLEVWNAKKIGLHDKPIGLLNINRYFDKFLQFMQIAEQEQFVKTSQNNLITVSDSPEELITQMREENNNSLAGPKV
jgi:uncharacterized protein (TIGR00730 family)